MDIYKKLNYFIMKFFPKSSKYTKYQKSRSVNTINSYLSLENLKMGSLGLKSVESGYLNTKQFKTIYQLLHKMLKKIGKIIFKIFPRKPITKKPIEVRMGKGKGAVYDWSAKIKAGTILFEIETLKINIALKALYYIQLKLPIKTRVIYLIN